MPSTGLSTGHPEPIQAVAPSLQCMPASALPREVRTLTPRHALFHLSRKSWRRNNNPGGRLDNRARNALSAYPAQNRPLATLSDEAPYVYQSITLPLAAVTHAGAT